MKTLILMRHSNPEARENNQHDAQRPLTEKVEKQPGKQAK